MKNRKMMGMIAVLAAIAIGFAAWNFTYWSRTGYAGEAQAAGEARKLLRELALSHLAEEMEGPALKDGVFSFTAGGERYRVRILPDATREMEITDQRGVSNVFTFNPFGRLWKIDGVPVCRLPGASQW